MSRKDFMFLAGLVRAMHRQGRMDETAVHVFAASLDTEYRNFDRDKFEEEALR